MLGFFSFLGNIWDFIKNDAYPVVRVVFLCLNFLMFVAIIYLFKRSLETRPKFLRPKELMKVSESPEKSMDVFKEWQEVLKKASVRTPHALTIAIIEADKLMDAVLIKMGFEGDQIAERLERLTKSRELKCIDKLWQAHRIRNHLVHSQGYAISPRNADLVLKAYQSFFVEIKALKE